MKIPFKTFKEVDWTQVEVDGVHGKDYPDFVDAYFSHGVFTDGTVMTVSDLESMADYFPEILQRMAMEKYL